jgi:uncharacterized protein YqgC (DUF456 family)
LKNFVWDFVKKLLGIVLIIGGILGLFLPFFQGIAMIVAGAILLNNKYATEKVRKLLAYFKKP